MTARTGGTDDPGVLAAAAAALDLVADGNHVGLGSGRASYAFISALGARCRDGLSVTAVAASATSTALAERVGVPLTRLGEGMVLDLTVDGADEVAPNLDLVKGWGGALVRERILANASRRQVILVGTEKLVRTIGQRGRIPVELVPDAREYVMRAMEVLGLIPSLRMSDSGGAPFVTENGNLTIDIAVRTPLADSAAAHALHCSLREIDGVVDTGLFLGTAERVIVGHSDGHVDILMRAQ